MTATIEIKNLTVTLNCSNDDELMLYINRIVQRGDHLAVNQNIGHLSPIKESPPLTRADLLNFSRHLLNCRDNVTMSDILKAIGEVLKQ